MQLLTPVPCPDLSPRIRYADPLFTAGSCFTDHMSRILESLQYRVARHPFGIVYHPLALARGFRRVIDQIPYTAADLQEQEGIWHSLDHHGSFSGTDPEQVLERLNAGLQKAGDDLRQTRFLLLTLGTARGYVWKAGGQLVANCHKFPARLFEPVSSGLDEIRHVLWELFAELFRMNPELRILLTVSPVRHLSDGLISNQRSKAALLLACGELCESDSRITYFPAYEIMMDELRDYRYYAEDMIHPTSQAVQYVWERFRDHALDPADSELRDAVLALNQAAAHRTLYPDSPAHRLFLLQQRARAASLKKRYAFLDTGEWDRAFADPV